ncbi:hypothetical protein ATANTOWER_014316 [Ataeniobius toweri]|uniref:Uncharacterized protein n=1 Tax=Ataeniobius toweri TaxID=208326 RepID=A0ABU7AZN1_9TELE|nr:hypothetical protein [Ataeniobius toweri]
MTVDFSDTSVYPGPSSKICCPALGDESASGTPTTGTISPLLNACPSVFSDNRGYYRWKKDWEYLQKQGEPTGSSEVKNKI